MVAREPVAQPVEHLTFNQRVSGSNPDGLTNFQDVGAKTATPPGLICEGTPAAAGAPFFYIPEIGDAVTDRSSSSDRKYLASRNNSV